MVTYFAERGRRGREDGGEGKRGGAGKGNEQYFLKIMNFVLTLWSQRINMHV